MVHESIRIFRLYCELTPEMVSEVTGIPLSRYKKIELGEIEPSEKDAEKLAKLFNVEVNDLLYGITDSSKYSVRQEIDDGLFATEEIKQMVKLKITDLSPKEKKLILLIRNSDNSESNFDEAINIILEK
ncbi:MAG: helix-turn-helix transcriptional regulator [Clostridia bacterium]|nr:helix-turn-helix transcriptional regulator [Clostridia bacterium]